MIESLLALLSDAPCDMDKAGQGLVILVLIVLVLISLCGLLGPWT